MTVSTALHSITADVSAMIATGAAPGRTELEKLRRNLLAATTDARRVETDAATARLVACTLAEGVDAGVLDLAGLARRAREQVGVAA